MENSQSLRTDPALLLELVHGREYTDGLLATIELADRRVDPPLDPTDDADHATTRRLRTSPLMPTLLV